jgi:prephenate dehydratase
MAKKPGFSVAFQGELGAFSFSAARKLLGNNIRAIPCVRFEDVFQTVASGAASHAVIPIENTLHGSVHENYDHLLHYSLPIIGETNIRISHQLIAMPNTRFRDIRRVFSHPVALNQCLGFFAKYKHIERVPFYDTAGSVKMLMEKHPEGSAAIASEQAAELYGGITLKRNIEDDRQNFTRFFLLTKQDKQRQGSGAWKTSLVFSTINAPGALFKAMACFALRDINLSKIESRPLRGKPWEYLFYVDLIGHREDEAVKNAITNLSEMTHLLHIFGSYQPTL